MSVNFNLHIVTSCPQINNTRVSVKKFSSFLALQNRIKLILEFIYGSPRKLAALDSSKVGMRFQNKQWE